MIMIMKVKAGWLVQLFHLEAEICSGGDQAASGARGEGHRLRCHCSRQAGWWKICKIMLDQSPNNFILFLRPQLRLV